MEDVGKRPGSEQDRTADPPTTASINAAVDSVLKELAEFTNAVDVIQQDTSAINQHGNQAVASISLAQQSAIQALTAFAAQKRAELDASAGRAPLMDPSDRGYDDNDPTV